MKRQLQRGTKQGDQLSPLLFGLIFNAHFLALKAADIGHRIVTGLQTSARCFSDGLVLVDGSSAGIQRLFGVVAKFCEWPWTSVKLEKSAITASGLPLVATVKRRLHA